MILKSLIAGLNRCGKSCRLRWLNYLRPNIKRGNISDQEEDLILRLHKLLGNRYVILFAIIFYVLWFPKTVFEKLCCKLNRF